VRGRHAKLGERLGGGPVGTVNVADDDGHLAPFPGPRRGL
jgi:hypothetical protein